MIELYLGNVGGGKTLSVIHYLINSNINHKVLSNIIPKSEQLKKIITPIKKSNIIIEKQIETKTRRRNSKGEYKEYSKFTNKLMVNVDFWKKQPKPITVILDEAHTLLNPRRSMSNLNIVMTEFVALLRRVIGSVTGEYGRLILITQLERRIDVIVREMTNVINYHIYHIDFLCTNCDVRFHYTNEDPEFPIQCPNCNKEKLIKTKQCIEVMKFSNFDDYNAYKYNGYKSYYSHYIIKNVETLFKHYDTFQWEEMLS